MTIGAQQAADAILDQTEGELWERLNAFIKAVDLAKFDEANASLDSLWNAGLPGPIFWKIGELLQPLIQPLEQELTLHGFKRTFRFWSIEEKQRYLQDAAISVIHVAEKELSPNICLAYGAALAYARSGDFIPHDDDIDLVIMMNRSHFPTYNSAAEHALEVLKRKNLDAYQIAPNLIKLYLSNGTPLDLFVALEENGYFCSFPGPRNFIKAADLFPPRAREFLGIEVPLPRRLETYLVKVYSADWRTPDISFAHSWDQTNHADLFTSTV